MTSIKAEKSVPDAPPPEADWSLLRNILWPSFAGNNAAVSNKLKLISL